MVSLKVSLKVSLEVSLVVSRKVSLQVSLKVSLKVSLEVSLKASQLVVLAPLYLQVLVLAKGGPQGSLQCGDPLAGQWHVEPVAFQGMEIAEMVEGGADEVRPRPCGAKCWCGQEAVEHTLVEESDRRPNIVVGAAVDIV